MKDRESLFSIRHLWPKGHLRFNKNPKEGMPQGGKKSFQNLIKKIFKKSPPKPKPVKVERDTTHLRKQLTKKAIGRRYRAKCLLRHQQKMTARRRAKNKSAARSRRINRKRRCRAHSAGRK
jgi:hypothetical protein